ncbi:MAG: nucleoside hydrolase [Microbacterium gubbeenense]
MSAPTRLILDTDFGGDCDDAAAIAMLHAMADNDEVTVLAIMVSNPTWFAVPGVQVINSYYGRGSIPVGTLKPRFKDVPNPPIPAAVVDSTNVTGYAETLATEWSLPLTAPDEPLEAVQLYRRVLAEQEDKSVTVAVIGGQTHLAALLRTGPDSYSPLSGHELVGAKVRELHAMAAEFPAGREWNVRLDPDAAQCVADSWPTPIVYSGYELGGAVHTGARLFTQTHSNNPVARAFEAHGAVGYGGTRPSWDQTTTYVAVRGTGTLFDFSPPGRLSVQSDGSNDWREATDGRHRHLLPAVAPTTIAEAIEDLMVQAPRGGWH